MEKPADVTGKIPAYDYNAAEKKDETKDRTLEIALSAITTAVVCTASSGFVFTCLSFGSLAVALVLLSESNLGRGHPANTKKMSGYWTPQETDNQNNKSHSSKNSPARPIQRHQNKSGDEFAKLHEKFFTLTPENKNNGSSSSSSLPAHVRLSFAQQKELLFQQQYNNDK